MASAAAPDLGRGAAVIGAERHRSAALDRRLLLLLVRQLRGFRLYRHGLQRHVPVSRHLRHVQLFQPWRDIDAVLAATKGGKIDVVPLDIKGAAGTKAKDYFGPLFTADPNQTDYTAKLEAPSSSLPATPKGSAKAIRQRPPARMARKYWNCVTPAPPFSRSRSVRRGQR